MMILLLCAFSFRNTTKGQEVLLIALQSIKQLLPSFTVVLGGCDEQYLENKKYLHKHYPGLKILIEGFSDKSDMYSLSDVIVLPSRTESFGYAAIESATIGLPLFLVILRHIGKSHKIILTLYYLRTMRLSSHGFYLRKMI